MEVKLNYLDLREVKHSLERNTLLEEFYNGMLKPIFGAIPSQLVSNFKKKERGNYYFFLFRKKGIFGKPLFIS